jgi:RNA recognition motif-containing protein
MRNIFIGNLAKETSEATLRSIFQAFGQVVSVNIVKDRDAGTARGFAFIEMNGDAEAQAAIAGVNGTNIDGHRVNVNEARSKPKDSSAIHPQMRRHREHRY